MIELKPVTEVNYSEVKKLKVSESQSRFIATPIKSLADAYVYKKAIFRAAYIEQDLFGYILVFPFEDKGDPVVNLVRIMVDINYQGKGLGKELLKYTMNWVRTFDPKPQRMRISALPDNVPAIKLYESFGFVKTGIENEEVTFWKDLDL